MGKKDKIPSPPRQPPKVPFFLYRDQIYQQTKQQYSSLNRHDLAEIISNKWITIDKETKSKYQEQLNQQKEKFQKDLQLYQHEFGKVDQETIRWNNYTSDFKGKKSHHDQNARESDLSDKSSNSKKKKSADKPSKSKSRKEASKSGKGKGKSSKSMKKSSKSTADTEFKQMWVLDRQTKKDSSDSEDE